MTTYYAIRGVDVEVVADILIGGAAAKVGAYEEELETLGSDFTFLLLCVEFRLKVYSLFVSHGEENGSKLCNGLK
jgi:hypothetical protein